MPVRQLSEADRQPHRRRRGGRAPGERGQGACGKRARCRRAADRRADRRRRAAADPRQRRRRRHDARPILRSRSSATPPRSSPTTIWSRSARSASAARRCPRSAPWRGCRSRRGMRGEPHAWAIEVDAGVKVRGEARGARRGHPRRGARPVLCDAGAAQIPQARPHRGRGGARSGAPARHEPARCRLHAGRRGARAGDLCGGAARRAPAGWRGSATCSAPNSAPMPSRSRPSATASRSKALPRCRR